MNVHKEIAIIHIIALVTWAAFIVALVYTDYKGRIAAKAISVSCENTSYIAVAGSNIWFIYNCSKYEVAE